MNLAKILKQRRDAERRLEQTSPVPVFNGGAADSVEGGGDESIASLEDYSKIGHTHDDRYYTETEVDALFAASSGYWEPLTNGDSTTPELLFYNGDVVMGRIS